MSDLVRSLLKRGLLAVAVLTVPALAQPDASVQIMGKEVTRTNLTLGYTYTHCTYNASQKLCDRAGMDRDAIEQAKSAERDLGTHFANVFVYGWGTRNPMPAPSEYKLDSFNERLALARASGGKLVVTLCCSPDWMVGAPPGTSDSPKMLEFPRREFWNDYVELAKRVARENPDVMYFQVWNEFKGLYQVDGSFAHWDYKTYTEFYNRMYSGIKEVRPDARVGGPYVVLTAWSDGNSPSHSELRAGGLEADGRPLEAMRYWMRNKTGADFIAMDAWNVARDVVDAKGQHRTSAFDRCKYFSAAAHWVRALPEGESTGAARLPIVWSEWYPLADDPRDGLSVLATCLIEIAGSGAVAALTWGPEGFGVTDKSVPLALWTGTGPGGGRPTKFYELFKEFNKRFPPGTVLRKVETTGPVAALASDSAILLVNQARAELRVSVGRSSVQLKAGEVTIRDRRGME